MSNKFDVLKSYDEMTAITVDFYKTLNIDIPSEFIKEAVQSLTMASYAKEYNESSINNGDSIKGHKALTTVGDAVCGAFLMVAKYKPGATQEIMHNYKSNLTNESLNPVGKELIMSRVFARNTDIKEGNTKDYADVFEAVIGFISVYIGIEKAFEVLKEHLIC